MNERKTLIVTLSLITILVITILPVCVNAFDGKQKGFQLGFGLGHSSANWTRSFGDVDETDGGLAQHIEFGYAWDDKNVVVFEITGTRFETEINRRSKDIQGITNINWYHYYRGTKRSIYTGIGLGGIAFVTDKTTNGGRGLGIKAEVGYEFLRSVLVGAYFFAGSTKSDGNKSNHKQAGILLKVVAY